MSISIRLLVQTDYLKIIKLAPDDDIMSSILFSIAKVVKDCLDEISYTYGAFIDDELIGFIYGFVLPNKTLLPQYLYIGKKYRGKKIGRQLLETLEKESKCTCSIAYFEKGLSEYYSKQGYMIGDTLVGLKELSSNDKSD